MKKSNRILVKLFEFLVPSGLFITLGVALGHGFLDNAGAGALIGLAAYLAIVLCVMLSDIVAINRELAAFRSARESD